MYVAMDWLLAWPADLAVQVQISMVLENDVTLAVDIPMKCVH